MKIVIGTRGSALSLVQTEGIKKKLESLLPKATIEIKIITTKGDKNMNPVPLDSIGKGWFTKELDRALLNKDIDIAVHSLKDLPEELPEGLIIAAIPVREDAREALVSKNNIPFDKLPGGAVVGTDSTRRKSQILHKRPDLQVESVRGNVITRLKKLDDGNYDALFLAVAGLKRLGLEKRITEYFNSVEIIPSPGQGALAVVTHTSNKKLSTVLMKMNDEKTVTSVHAERAFSKEVGGGCKLPVGAYAEIKNKKITIQGMIGSLDGVHLEKHSISGKAEDADKLAIQLAEKLLEVSKGWYQIFTDTMRKYIVITRPFGEDQDLQLQIEKLGLQTYLYPTISIDKNSLSNDNIANLKKLDAFDWVVFTSKNGVKFLMQTLEELGIDSRILRTKKIGVVGPVTKRAAEAVGMTVHFIPTSYTTETLGNELKNIAGKKILLPRSNIANIQLTKILEKKDAVVVDVPIYKTEFVFDKNADFIAMLNEDKIHMITFTSPSTIRGFMKCIPDTMIKEVLSIPVLSIGPITSTAAKEIGFKKIMTAKSYTTVGMIKILQKSIL